MLKTLRLGNDDFTCTHETEADVRDVIFAGRWATPPIQDMRQAVHVLDLEPREGEFACYAWMRYGGPWIDCLVAPNAKPVYPHLRRNLPPSARIIETIPEHLNYDVIHAGEDVDGGVTALLRCRPRCFAAEWNSEKDRRALDQHCFRAGLRLFKSELRDADVGRALWIKSAAKYVPQSNEYRLTA